MASKRGLMVSAALAAAVVAAAAAGWWWTQGGGLRGGARSGAELMGGSDPTAPFVARDCTTRLLDDSPALALVFSQPLDRKQKLGDLLKVSDLGPAEGQPEANPKVLQNQWVIGDNPRIAYFPFIAPQRKYRIEVQAGLLAGDGRKLAEPKRCEVASEAVSPSFFFASRGVVLPAQQNGGLPVVTLNVPEVDLQFLRINPADLPRFFERVAGSRRSAEAPSEDEYHDEGRYDENRALKGRVVGWDLDQLNSSSRSVYLGRFRTEQAPNKRRVTFIPVEDIKELQEPGVYVAVMSQPGRFREDYQVTYFYVSDIGVQAQRHSTAIDAFATSLKTGEPLADVEFELLDGDARSLGKARGDGQGHALLANAPDSATLLVARRGKEMTVIALREPGLDLSEFDIGGHLSRNTKLFAYAGRDLYRPGEQFQLSVLARNADGRAIPPQPLTATLKRPDGRTVSTSAWAPRDQQPGYYQQAVSLPADAMTGAWLLELRADPGAKQPDALWKFQVEEFLPERMKLDLATAKPVLGKDDPFEVDVTGNYLFGAPAAGNRLLVNVATERQRFAQPQKWPGFIFGDFADDASKKREEVPEQSLDDEGKASVTLPVPATGAKSPMLVRGSFSLLESGGRPVVRSIERVVWPAPALLALRPLFDRDVAQENAMAEFELTRVNTEGAYAPLPAPGQVRVRLLREDRQYYWRFDDQKGWHSGYIETDEPLESASVALAQRARLKLPVGYGRYRVELDDPVTGQTLRYRFYAGWGAQDAESLGNRPDRVQLKLANAPLKAGDKAQLTITPPHDGHALVTVVGDKLLWRQRLKVAASGTALEIPIDPAWQRHDLYVAVTAFRPGSAGDRVTPARALGLQHLPLQRADRKLQLAVSAPPKVLPETRVPVKIKVEGLANQAAIVTLSAVDVGILNITRYKTPDPFDFFFGKHRLAPEFTDMYGKLIEKMDGQRGKLAFGGDARPRDSQSLPKKVKLVDLFSGPVQLDAKGEATVPLDIPDFNGTLRLMAVAATADKFTSAEAQTVSAAPIVAELSMPRFISPGDAAQLALDVTNLTTEVQVVKVNLEGAEPVRVADGERSLSLKPQQRQTLRFPVEATDAYGLGRLRLRVASDRGIRITRESVLQVQPPAALERDVRRAKLDPGGTLKLEPALLERYFRGSSHLSVTLSNQPPLNVNRLVQGLLDYAYGCLEQTTSAAYPHLFIDEEGAKAVGLAPRSRAERTAFVEGAIGRLAGMQKSNGGYTLWGDGPYETWLSAYVTGFLLDARQQGFNVPEPMVKKSHDWLLQELQQTPNRFPTLPRPAAAASGASRPAAAGSGAAQAVATAPVNWRDYELLRDSHKRFAELAHVAYMLARDQKAPLATLRLLHDQYRDRARSPLPLVHLALALKLMGDDARAKVALDDAMLRSYGIRADQGWGYEWLGDYGSPARDLALAYALLHRHEMTHPRRENLLFDLADRMGGRQYYSTQERLSLFLAARAAGGRAGEEWAVLLKAGDKPPQAIATRSTEQRSFDAAALARGLSLSHQSGGALFLELEASGYPMKTPVPRQDVIELRRDWFDAQGKPVAGRSFKVGDLLIVRLQARSRQRIEDAMLIDRIPAGFEVENLNLSQGPRAEEFNVGNVNVAQAMADDRIKHREYRDDRYVAAARLNNDWLNVFYMLRVVSPGRFVVPQSFAEDMYRPELRAVGPVEPPITITDPRGGGLPVVEPAAAASAPR